jgi:hypothetical protein
VRVVRNPKNNSTLLNFILVGEIEIKSRVGIEGIYEEGSVLSVRI